MRPPTPYLRMRSLIRYRMALLFLSLLLLVMDARAVHAQDPGPRAGLVILGADGVAQTYCISLDADSLTGAQLLEHAGVTPTFQISGMGTALCALDGSGCPESDCFCQCKGTPCHYWNYFIHDAEGAWAYSGIGAAQRQVQGGDADAWVWGDGATPPPTFDFATLCPVQDAGPSAAPTYQVIVPLIGGQPVSTPTRDLPAWLPPGVIVFGRRYGSLVLLLLALAALFLLKRARR